jgi:prepilin-type N-terminal cleavage/methylation domain-containing protein
MVRLKGAFSESAFAMVELLVVMAVMAIIIAIVLIFIY